MASYSFDGTYEGWRIAGGKITKGAISHNIAGAVADFEHGAQRKGLTASRVVLTGIFALALKKDKSKVYIPVQLADGQQLLIEGKTKNEREARLFASKINAAGAAFAKQAPKK